MPCICAGKKPITTTPFSGTIKSIRSGGVEALNPGFDVTPADLIDFIVTEKGVIDRPDAEKMAQLMCRKRLH